MEGGLLHLFNVLADRKLEEAGGKLWSEVSTCISLLIYYYDYTYTYTYHYGYCIYFSIMCYLNTQIFLLCNLLFVTPKC